MKLPPDQVVDDEQRGVDTIGQQFLPGAVYG